MPLDNTLATTMPSYPVAPAKPKAATPTAIPTMEGAGENLIQTSGALTDATTGAAAAEAKAATAKGNYQEDQNKYVEGLRQKEEGELRGLDQGEFKPSESTLGNMAALFTMVGMLGAFLGGKKTSGAAASAQGALTGMMKGWVAGQNGVVAQQKAVFDENAAYLKDKADKVRQIYQDYYEDAQKFGIPIAQGRLQQRLVTEAEADVNAQRVKLSGAQAASKQAEDIFKIAGAFDTKVQTLEAAKERQQESFSEKVWLSQMMQAKNELTPEAVHELGEAFVYTGKMPPLGFSAGGRTQILNAAMKIASDLGIHGQDLGNIAAGYVSNETSLKAISKVSDAVHAYERTMLANMKVAQGIGKDQVDNTMPWLNRWVQTGQTQFGNEKVPAYAAALVTVADNYAKILSGSTGAAGSTDASRTQAFGILNQYLNTGQVGQVFNVIRADANNRARGYDVQKADIQDRIKAGSGGIPGAKSLNTEDSQALDWANSHPGDPRAAKIKQRLGEQ